MIVLVAFVGPVTKHPRKTTRLSVDAVDGARVSLLRQFERTIGLIAGVSDLKSFAIDAELDVYDRRTKRFWRVRTADCGFGCRCAIQARPATKTAKDRRKLGRLAVNKSDVVDFLREYRADRRQLKTMNKSV